MGGGVLGDSRVLLEIAVVVHESEAIDVAREAAETSLEAVKIVSLFVPKGSPAVSQKGREEGSEIFYKTVSAGTWEIPELELRHGANTISITGEGSVTFIYREGRL